MTERDRKLLMLIAPVAVLAALWFLVFSPKRQESQRLDGEISAAQTRLSTAQGDLARYEQARRELSANVSALRGAGRAVPANAAVPALLRQLERTAKRSHVEMRAITTGAGSGKPATAAPPTSATAAPGGEVTSVGLTLTFEGRYFALERFFARLDRFIEVSRKKVDATGRLLNVRSLDLAAGPAGLSAQVAANVFVLPDISALLPPAAPAAPAGQAVPAAATPQPGAAPLATVGVQP